MSTLDAAQDLGRLGCVLSVDANESQRWHGVENAVRPCVYGGSKRWLRDGAVCAEVRSLRSVGWFAINVASGAASICGRIREHVRWHHGIVSTTMGCDMAKSSFLQDHFNALVAAGHWDKSQRSSLPFTHKAAPVLGAIDAHELKSPDGFIGHVYSEADAAFIVRACNSHDELLAACQDLVKVAKTYGYTGGSLQRAQAALAKADRGSLPGRG